MVTKVRKLPEINAGTEDVGEYPFSIQSIKDVCSQIGPSQALMMLTGPGKETLGITLVDSKILVVNLRAIVTNIFDGNTWRSVVRFEIDSYTSVTKPSYTGGDFFVSDEGIFDIVARYSQIVIREIFSDLAAEAEAEAEAEASAETEIKEMIEDSS